MQSKGGVTLDWWEQADDVARDAVVLTLNTLLEERSEGGGSTEDWIEELE
jgi:hypothetical protein